MLIYDLVEIGKRIRIRRECLGLTQAEVAEKAKISVNTYICVEKGQTHMRIKTFLKICEILCVASIDTIISENETAFIEENKILKKLINCNLEDKKVVLKFLLQNLYN